MPLEMQKPKNSCKPEKAVLQELSDCQVSNNCKKGKGELFSQRNIKHVTRLLEAVLPCLLIVHSPRQQGIVQITWNSEKIRMIVFILKIVVQNSIQLLRFSTISDNLNIVACKFFEKVKAIVYTLLNPVLYQLQLVNNQSRHLCSI